MTCDVCCRRSLFLSNNAYAIHDDLNDSTRQTITSQPCCSKLHGRSPSFYIKVRTHCLQAPALHKHCNPQKAFTHNTADHLVSASRFALVACSYGRSINTTITQTLKAFTHNNTRSFTYGKHTPLPCILPCSLSSMLFSSSSSSSSSWPVATPWLVAACSSSWTLALASLALVRACLLLIINDYVWCSIERKHRGYQQACQRGWSNSDHPSARWSKFDHYDGQNLTILTSGAICT